MNLCWFLSSQPQLPTPCRLFHLEEFSNPPSRLFGAYEYDEAGSIFLKIGFHFHFLFLCLNCNRLITLEQQGDAKETLCNICYCSTNLRVLKCRHAFCVSCLETIHAINNGRISCPVDGTEDIRKLHVLPTVDQSDGKVLNTWVVENMAPNFEKLIADLVGCRKITIKHLRDVAELLNSREFKCAISKLSGTAAVVSCIGTKIVYSCPFHSIPKQGKN